MNKRGMTLAEVMIAMVLLGLLTGALFYIFRLGSNVWAKGDTESELLGSISVVEAKLSREAERSVYESVSVEAAGQGVAFLSPMDANGVFRYDPITSMPRWQKYIVIYHDPAQKALLWREVPVVGSPTENTAGPIELFSGSTLASFFSGGKVLARELTGCRFWVGPDRQLLVWLEAEKERYGSSTPEHVEWRTAVSFRN
ncbi:MAG: type II secretion system protein [Candidatus Eremiobacteraeota bacterium]|nr:type II secretion system protein [Candidatus Eremiobacteraeota bacterium]